MIKFSLSSYHKKIHLFIYTVFSAAFIVISINVVTSVIINSKLAGVGRLIQTKTGYTFRPGFAYFNLLQGLRITGIRLDKDKGTLFSIKRCDIGFDMLSLLQLKIRIKNLSFTEPRVSLNRVPEAVPVLGEIFRTTKIPVGFFQTSYFVANGCWVDNIIQFDTTGYFSYIKGNILTSRGELILKKIQVQTFGGADIFRGSSFYKPFDFVFESQTQGSDFVISRLECSNPVLKFTGNGTIFDFAANAKLDFEINFKDVMLGDFPAINQGYVKSQGKIDSSLSLKGQIGNLDSLLKIKITGAEFRLFDSLFFTGINGTSIFSNNHLIGHDFSLKINNIPFDSHFVFYKGRYPHFLLRLSSLDKIKNTEKLKLDVSADWIANELSGGIKAKMLYVTDNSVNDLDLNLDGFHFGYKGNVFLRARTLRSGLLAGPSAAKPAPAIAKNLVINDLSLTLRREASGFVLDQLKASAYGGTLDGEVDFLPHDGLTDIKGELHLKDVDLVEFFKEIKDNPYKLSGKLAGDLRFNNHFTDMVKGQLFITGGTVEQIPILNAVADFLAVPSLKKLTFDDLSIFFAGGRGSYVLSAKLQSPQVNGVLEGKIFSYDKMDGYLSVGVSTQLLNESKQFKKLLTYISHDEPSVIFPFKILSYIHNPRILWLKNEFKEKLQNLLPARNQQFLQSQVNVMIEKIEEE